MIRAAALFALLLTYACGGGGGGPSASGTITPAGVLRADLFFGYYGQNSVTVLETTPHANLVWAAEFNGPLEQMAALTMARQAGVKTVVPLPLCALPVERIEGEATTWLARLRDAGLLENVAAVAWCDEPNTDRSGGWSDAGALAAIAAVRRAMATVHVDAAIVTLYACAVSGRPGADGSDWLGCDDYDRGCGVVSRYYDGWALKAGQRLVLLPGGADPWRQDPACFVSAAERDGRVVAVIAFIWQTVTDGGNTYRGIRENPLRTLYCQAGTTIKAARAATAKDCP